MKIHSVLYSPVLTEKSTQLAQQGVYLFEVNTKATKHQVSEAVQTLFKGVEVASVRMIVRKGKNKRVGRRMMTKQLPAKKVAYVTVSKGTIDLFPQA